jgi:hypothetical protein
MPLCCVPFQKKLLLFACNGIDINVCIYMCGFLLFVHTINVEVGYLTKKVDNIFTFAFFTFNFLFTFLSKLATYSNWPHIINMKNAKIWFYFILFFIWKIVISLVTISFIIFSHFQLVRLYLISCTLVQKLPSWFRCVLQYKKVVVMKHY